jgi:ABC-type Fe3+ transport system permease subunit
MAMKSVAQWKSTDRRLWTAMSLGPLAAAINTIVGYTVSHYACETREKAALFTVMIVDLAICLCGVLVARSTQNSLNTGDDPPVPHDRQIFMLHLAVGLCTFCALLTVAGTLAVVILQPCD